MALMHLHMHFKLFSFEVKKSAACPSRLRLATEAENSIKWSKTTRQQNSKALMHLGLASHYAYTLKGHCLKSYRTTLPLHGCSPGTIRTEG